MFDAVANFLGGGAGMVALFAASVALARSRRDPSNGFLALFLVCLGLSVVHDTTPWDLPLMIELGALGASVLIAPALWFYTWHLCKTEGDVPRFRAHLIAPIATIIAAIIAVVTEPATS